MTFEFGKFRDGPQTVGMRRRVEEGWPVRANPPSQKKASSPLGGNNDTISSQYQGPDITRWGWLKCVCVWCHAPWQAPVANGTGLEEPRAGLWSFKNV